MPRRIFLLKKLKHFEWTGLASELEGCLFSPLFDNLNLALKIELWMPLSNIPEAQHQRVWNGEGEIMTENEDFVFYRRCHVCNCVSRDNEPILKCQECAMQMAPFFYFDVRRTRVYADAPFDNTAQEEEYRPIEGLTAFWWNEDKAWVDEN